MGQTKAAPVVPKLNLELPSWAKPAASAAKDHFDGILANYVPKSSQLTQEVEGDDVVSQIVYEFDAISQADKDGINAILTSMQKDFGDKVKVSWKWISGRRLMRRLLA